LEPVVVTPRTTAVTAMAYSPWTSLFALAAPKQILLYDTDTKHLVGIFPYTEGYARSLRFSRNGSLLIMGGGRGGKNGHAIVWDVKTGKRITEVGKEFDQVMSADISPDHKLVVIGSLKNEQRHGIFYDLDPETGDTLRQVTFQNNQREGETLSFLEEAQPGDLAFFDNEEGRIIHVGILVRPDQIIHCSGQVRLDGIDQHGIYNFEERRHTHRLRLIKSILTLP
jgi:hypothetical protein